MSRTVTRATTSRFDQHYSNNHTPLVEKIPNLGRFEAAKVVGAPNGGQPEYY